ncbi:hypothetical protein ACFB49_33950 [Sphingomonas sp. DBB INV C78]|uniref:hypothetical protein n=1 Tax=Sphingomonas sp. DBB INV C78 TaxID=3349434 RepID=UPI0036D3A427
MGTMPFFFDPLTREYDSRIWNDQYVLGVIHGMVSGSLVIGGYSLSTKDKGRVVIDVFAGLGAEPWVARFATEMVLNGDADFQRGSDDAVCSVMIGASRLKSDLYAQPDIANALADAPAFQREMQAYSDSRMVPLEEAHAAAFLFRKVRAHQGTSY